MVWLTLRVEGEMRRHSGVDLIDNIVEPYPKSSAILIMGGAGTGKTVLCQQFVGEALRRREKVAYIALDDFPDHLRQSMSWLGYDVKTYCDEGRLIFVDGYSGECGVKSHEAYSTDRNLTNLSIIASQILSKSFDLLVLDSLTTLFQKCGFEAGLNFLSILVAKTRASDTTLLIKFNTQAFDPAVAAAVQDKVDGVIDMKRIEKSLRLHYIIRVSKMRGTRHKTTWTLYEIAPDHGLIRSGETS